MTTHRRAPSPPESSIQRVIIEWLTAHRYYVIRLNSGMTVIEQPQRRVIRSQPKGTPDLLVFKGGQYTFIEVKRPGDVPRPEQCERMALLRAHGARCIVATSVEDVQRALEEGVG